MTTKTIVKRKADDFKTGMTVAEINEWFDEVAHAMHYSGKGAGAVRCTINMRGGIKELSVEVTTDD